MPDEAAPGKGGSAVSTNAPCPDQYNVEYNRDIEPGNNPMGTYYYDLVTSCLSLFRAGQRCTPDHAAELCCHDWQG